MTFAHRRTENIGVDTKVRRARRDQRLYLISESVDHKLSWWQRINLWMHIGMCGLCWRFRKDLLHLHEEAREQAEQIEQDVVDSDVKLSDNSRDRMKRLLES